VLSQGPCLRTLAAVALGTLRPRPKETPTTPGPVITATLPPRPEALLTSYRAWCGGAADALPAHLFPQWGFPLMAKALGTLPWPMTRVLNQGCRVASTRALDPAAPLECTAQLTALSEEPAKARITTTITTRAGDGEVRAEVYAVVPLKGGKKKGGKRREPATVPAGADCLAWFELSPRAGLDFALLTGDFNPIHWIPPAARASGFKAPILHGFAALALAGEALIARRLGGDARALTEIDVRFVGPLVLPAKVGLFVTPGEDGRLSLTLGPGEGERATMVGTALVNTAPVNTAPVKPATVG